MVCQWTRSWDVSSHKCLGEVNPTYTSSLERTNGCEPIPWFSTISLNWAKLYFMPERKLSCGSHTWPGRLTGVWVTEPCIIRWVSRRICVLLWWLWPRMANFLKSPKNRLKKPKKQKKPQLFYFKRLVFKRWQAVSRSCLKAESPHCLVEGGLAYFLNHLYIQTAFSSLWPLIFGTWNGEGSVLLSSLHFVCLGK